MKNTSISEKGKKPPKAFKKAKINLLETIENIIELAEDSKLDKELFKKAKKDLKNLSDAFQITIDQALLFAVVVNYSSDSRIRLYNFTRFFNCREIKLLRMESDFEALKERKLIRIKYDKDKDARYSISNDVLNSLKNNEIYEPEETKIEIKTLNDWFEYLAEAFEAFNKDEITFDELDETIEELLEKYTKFDFSKKLKSLKLSDFDKRLLICVCHLFVHESDDHIQFDDLDDYFDTRGERLLKRFFKNRDTQLFEKNLVDWVVENDVGHRRVIKLSDAAKTDLLAELDLGVRTKPKKDFLVSGDIIEKPLFYNDKEGKQVAELQKLLSPDYFQSVQDRMKDKGMQQGFSCLFYGSPGTGKTESVYQLAKQTNRDIFIVDISNTKSCWFGESEKKIKEVFNKYKTLVKNSDVTPILLFNEADAVFGKRKDVSSSNVAQTENAIQNIILQEMETFNGILIATTNLTDNLDAAFERRFVYKIKFEKPTVLAKQKIWQSKLSNLTDDESLKLAQKFDFSGGEIDNISRKTAINEILLGDKPLFEDVERLCSEERISTRAPIGF